LLGHLVVVSASGHFGHFLGIAPGRGGGVLDGHVVIRAAARALGARALGPGERRGGGRGAPPRAGLGGGGGAGGRRRGGGRAEGRGRAGGARLRRPRRQPRRPRRARGARGWGRGRRRGLQDGREIGRRLRQLEGAVVRLRFGRGLGGAADPLHRVEVLAAVP